MGSLNSVDITGEGFGAFSGAFAAPVAGVTPFGRLIRILRASNSRITITGIDLSWFVQGQAINTTRQYTVPVTVFRQSAANPFPDFNLAFITVARVMPSGVECLFTQNVYGSVTTIATGGTYPANLSANSFKFEPGVISADAGQVLIVTTTQPISADGVAFVGGTTILSVVGFDYGQQKPTTTVPGERSYPRF